MVIIKYTIMKRKFTEKRAARRGPSKTMFNAYYSMPVAERRRRGIQAADSEEYDKKHGVGVSAPAVSRIRRAFTRRQA